MHQLMQENGIERVMWGDAWALDNAFEKSGTKAKYRHPLDRWKSTLDALDKDDRFIKSYCRIDIWHIKGWRKIYVRVFALRSVA